MEKEINLLNEVNEIFNQIIGEEIELDISMTKSLISEWDSIFHLSLIVDLESKYNLSFTTEEIENLDSIKKIIHKINN
jgi:acyl carrier protein